MNLNCINEKRKEKLNPERLSLPFSMAKQEIASPKVFYYKESGKLQHRIWFFSLVSSLNFLEHSLHRDEQTEFFLFLWIKN